jgi:hypothetical protein
MHVYASALGKEGSHQQNATKQFFTWLSILLSSWLSGSFREEGVVWETMMAFKQVLGEGQGDAGAQLGFPPKMFE